MSTFELTIMTPEREFFSGKVEALTITGLNGKLTVLANHAPMVGCLDVGTINIKTDGEWKEAFNSEGFLDVLDNTVVVFVQSCEWPNEIDVKRAREAKMRAEEQLRQKRSIIEYNASKIALARAMTRLSIASRRK